MAPNMKVNADAEINWAKAKTQSIDWMYILMESLELLMMYPCCWNRKNSFSGKKNKNFFEFKRRVVIVATTKFGIELIRKLKATHYKHLYPYTIKSHR